MDKVSFQSQKFSKPVNLSAPDLCIKPDEFVSNRKNGDNSSIQEPVVFRQDCEISGLDFSCEDDRGDDDDNFCSPKKNDEKDEKKVIN